MCRWIDSRDHSKRVSYELRSNEKIETGQTKRTSLATRCIYDIRDYIVRRFEGYGNSVEVIINKPIDLDLHLIWFLSAPGHRMPKPTMFNPITNATSYTQKVEGPIFPGNGFVVIWWPRQNNN